MKVTKKKKNNPSFNRKKIKNTYIITMKFDYNGIFRAKGTVPLLPLSKGSGGLKSQTSRPLTKSVWEQGDSKDKNKSKGKGRSKRQRQTAKAKLKKNYNY